MRGQTSSYQERHVDFGVDRLGPASAPPQACPWWRIVRTFGFVAVQTVVILGAVLSPAWADLPVNQTWDAEYAELLRQIDRRKQSTKEWRDRLQAEALDPQAVILTEDRDPLDVVLRRTKALLQYFQQHEQLSPAELGDFDRRWSELTVASQSAPSGDARRALFTLACALRRDVSLANPLLDFEQIVCMIEQPGDLRIVEQARAECPGHSNGGGPVVIRNFKTQAQCVPVWAGVPVTSGPWRGKKLTGKFSGLELSYDGTQLLFAATTDADIWHVFRFHLATQQLEQLTDGPADDFDPHPLPSGRIVFTSTRRGGVGRCVLTPQSLTYTLHSMLPDGSDIICLSFHETNEWAPTVTHSGKIAYTRWDYVDRHWGTAHHFWECFPDGRDPRNLHGNYPWPWSAMPEGVRAGGLRQADAGVRSRLAAGRGNIVPSGPQFPAIHGHCRGTP